jgi:hypothetical protein
VELHLEMGLAVAVVLVRLVVMPLLVLEDKVVPDFQVVLLVQRLPVQEAVEGVETPVLLVKMVVEMVETLELMEPQQPQILEAEVAVEVDHLVAEVLVVPV